MPLTHAPRWPRATCDIAIATARGVIDAKVRGGVSIVMAPIKAQCSTMDGSLCADSNRRRARQRTTDESDRSRCKGFRADAVHAANPTSKIGTLIASGNNANARRRWAKRQNPLRRSLPSRSPSASAHENPTADKWSRSPAPKCLPAHPFPRPPARPPARLSLPHTNPHAHPHPHPHTPTCTPTLIPPAQLRT